MSCACLGFGGTGMIVHRLGRGVSAGRSVCGHDDSGEDVQCYPSVLQQGVLSAVIDDTH